MLAGYDFIHLVATGLVAATTRVGIVASADLARLLPVGESFMKSVATCGWRSVRPAGLRLARHVRACGISCFISGTKLLSVTLPIGVWRFGGLSQRWIQRRFLLMVPVSSAMLFSDVAQLWIVRHT